MSLRVCAEPGCPELVEQGARGGRCDEHRKGRDRARGTRQQRGYDRKHERLRAKYQRRMWAGEDFICWRCLEERGIEHVVDPECWDLGHDDHDRSIYRGPECRAGNRATRARAVPRISPDA